MRLNPHAERLQHTLTAYFDQMRSPLELYGDASAYRAYWVALLAYARLFVEEPLLVALTTELRSEAQRHEGPLEDVRAEALRRLEPARDHLLDLAKRYYDPQRWHPELAELMRFGCSFERDPNGLADRLLSIAQRLRRDGAMGEPDTDWDRRASEVQQTKDDWRKLVRSHEMFGRIRPWKAWLLLEDFARAPEVLDSLDTSTERAATICVALMGHLGLEAPPPVAYEVLPSPQDLTTRLFPLHQWVIGRLMSGHAKLATVQRYRESVEWYRRHEVQELLVRVAQGNDDEGRLRDHIAAYLHDHGFSVSVEPRRARSRPDVLAAHPNTNLEIPIEVKVIRADDLPSPIRARLRSGMFQALRYTRQAHCAEGFLVIYWDSEREFDYPDIAEFEDCTVNVVTVDLRGPPSKQSARVGIRLATWRELIDGEDPT